MNSSVFCTFLMIGSVLYFVSSYSTSFLEEIYSVQPIIITTNKRIKEKAKLINNEAKKSPLFQSMKTRYHQMFPDAQLLANLSKIEQNMIDADISQYTAFRVDNKGQSIPRFEETESYWKYMSQIYRNKTFNSIFEIKDENHQEQFYLLNANNEVISNLTFNPYFGEITLMRTLQKPYFKLKEQSMQQYARKGSKQQVEEKHFDGNTAIYANPKQIHTCFQSYVPGIILYVAMNQYSKEQFLVVYRILTFEGAIHRIRVFNNIDCNNEGLSYGDLRTNQGEIELDKTLKYENHYSYGDSTVKLGTNYEDFKLDGNFQITAISYMNKDTITYSRLLDFYQYRVLQRYVNEKTGEINWKETQRGPLIDRTKDKIFICTGIHQIETGMKNISTYVVAYLKGESQQQVQIKVELQQQINQSDQYTEENSKEPNWQTKTQIYDRKFPIYQSPNVYNHDLTIHLSQFSDRHQKNQIITMFGQYFLALDWDQKAQNILVFDTFKEPLNDYIDLMTVSSDNTNLFLYSQDSNILYQIFRERGQSEKVMEEWLEVRLNNLPSELMNKRILSIYLKNLPQTKERIMMMLFEGGILGSFKIEELNEDFLSALEILEDETFLDIVFPLVVLISASIVLCVKRRRQSQLLNPNNGVNNAWPMRGGFPVPISRINRQNGVINQQNINNNIAGANNNNNNNFNQQDIVGGIPFNQLAGQQDQDQIHEQQPAQNVPIPVRIENLNPLNGDMLEPQAEDLLDENINNLNRLIQELDADNNQSQMRLDQELLDDMDDQDIDVDDNQNQQINQMQQRLDFMDQLVDDDDANQ
ncbi:UNKNOWN [Stylonychia lemnae]|uniref:Transmembrane protein n=1 Tax=Stylonychia lemnae TaxID=5949 RepID=A0A078AKF5_STYLE|nr:UNKNOWN [Stylonychia lemnae]|eukprot:CDW82694.1 UNKNOWN [Stylonychia lemnae]